MHSIAALCRHLARDGAFGARASIRTGVNVIDSLRMGEALVTIGTAAINRDYAS